MRKIEIIKTIELFILIALSIICFYLIILRTNVYHQVTESMELRLLCSLLWFILFVSFMFIFVDFSLYTKQKSKFNALDYAVHSDNLAKIANRQGIDEVIEKYLDNPLPAHLGCMMLLLTSLKDVNSISRVEGNNQIRAFSVILKLASVNMCFVGRNGGNVFLAIFEETIKEKIDNYIRRINKKVSEYNQKENVYPMYFKYGIAFDEGDEIKTINELISLANKRAQAAEICPKNAGLAMQEMIKQQLPYENAEVIQKPYMDQSLAKIEFTSVNTSTDIEAEDKKGIEANDLIIKGSDSSVNMFDIESIKKARSEKSTEATVKKHIQTKLTSEEDDYRYTPEELSQDFCEDKDYKEYREVI